MKPLHLAFITLALAITTLQSCSPEAEIVSLGIDDSYSIARMRLLRLHPEYSGDSYTWTMPDREGNDSVISRSRDLLFVGDTPGEYRVKLQIADAQNPVTATTRIAVWNEEVAYDPYITRCYEYRPAPGQFVNTLPQYEAGDDEASMAAKAEKSIAGTAGSLITLGGWGGYVTFGFDHTVVNRKDCNDFLILGNSFISAPGDGGSAEPGIVMVSLDVNGNGRPDDPWYELAGSEYRNSATLHRYTVDYHRPAQPGDNIAWDDNRGNSGTIDRNTFHTQPYFPQWLDAATLSFSGSRLPDNAVLQPSGQYLLYAYPWGYADNHPNNEPERCSFDIGNAVDDDGNPINLPGADFIRVYTGVNQKCGAIGETSTEIACARDLHIAP